MPVPFLFLFLAVSSAAEFPPVINSLLPSDAVSLLSFKAKADLDNKLLFELNERFDYCQWRGVKCGQGRVVRFSLPSSSLRGVFSPNTLSRLDQLRVLCLRNNSLSGPIPDLSSLPNLRSLFLSRNHFSGSFPPSFLLLHRLRVLDLSSNNLSGLLPSRLPALDRLSSLRLDSNLFSGPLPPLNQSHLDIFNVSSNNLTGPIPLTPTLSSFAASSFSLNPGLCGEIVNRACDSRPPFFNNTSINATSHSSPLAQTAQSGGGGTVYLAPPSPRAHHRTALILGFAVGVTVLVASLLCVFGFVRRQSSGGADAKERRPPSPEIPSFGPAVVPAEETGKVQKSEGKVVEVVERRVRRSGDVIFCAGEEEAYTLDQLMRASAELLGRGSVGTTYKAVLDNQLIVTVKRLDANKTAVTTAEVFDRHMDAVGGLRHPNLVPVRAYFQAKGERLVVYDYQANGSLSNLIHGSRSNRARPLHWTSCLKIAEDVAQGLAYIHQASRLIHGNLKSSNVLLGADFEACLTDYCLAFLADSSSYDDPDSARYKAPETRKSSSRASSKSDVYAFGILLLELLTGRHPSQHPFLEPTDVLDWVRAMRDDDGSEDGQLQMLTEVGSICSLTSPEQRPAMWQVLKMIQEIKESVLIEDNSVSVGFT